MENLKSNMSATLDKLIYLFVSSDRNLPHLAYPSMENDIVYATDTKILIAVPKKYLKDSHESNPRFPDCEKLLPQIEKPLFSFDTDDLIRLYNEMPLQNIYAPCDACEGEGKHKCTCGDKHSCGECNGSGKSKYVEGQGCNPYAYWSIEGKLFYPERIIKAAKIAMAIGEKKMHVMEVGDTIFMKIADVRCKLIGCMDFEDEEEKGKVVTDLTQYKFNA